MNQEPEIDLRAIRETDDVEYLLDTRADALDAINEIEMQIQADKTMPRPDHMWRKRAFGAMRFKMTLARIASARLLQIAPDELAIEQQDDPPLSPMALQEENSRLTRELAAAHDRNIAYTAEIARLTQKSEAQKAHIATMLAAKVKPAPEDKLEKFRIMMEHQERSRVQKLEAQRIRDEDAGRRFIDAARAVLSTEQYQDLWRAAGMDGKL